MKYVFLTEFEGRTASYGPRFFHFTRKFKIYDAMGAKTSLKIARSSLYIFFVIMSICLTFESQRNYPETELRGAVLKLGKKIQIRGCVFTFPVKLEKWSFHVADSPRKGNKCTEIKKACESRAKLLFLFNKCSKFVALSIPSHRRS